MAQDAKHCDEENDVPKSGDELHAIALQFKSSSEASSSLQTRSHAHGQVIPLRVNVGSDRKSVV